MVVSYACFDHNLSWDKISVEKGAQVTHTIAPELVSLDGDKDLVVHQILHSSAAGGLLGSAELPTKLPLPGWGHVTVSAVVLCWLQLNICWAAGTLGCGHVVICNTCLWFLVSSLSKILFCWLFWGTRKLTRILIMCAPQKTKQPWYIHM